MINLTEYICHQLAHIVPHPESSSSDKEVIERYIEQATKRFRQCALGITSFSNNPDPDPWHIQKYPVFLYFLARSIHEAEESDVYRLKDRLYCLNKALHGCSLYYRVKLPNVFLVSYASGVILGNCVYGENLLAYQGVTVGGYRSKAPVLGNNIVLMPNAVISGSTVLGNNVVVSSGVRVINQIIPDNSVVFEGSTKELSVKSTSSTEYIETFFHL